MSETSSELFPVEADLTPVVIVKDGQAFANSRDVAAFFGKEHRGVLRDIDNMIAAEADLGLHSFVHTPYVEPQNGQTYRSFDMTRDGFTLLAMGFTGAKALRWKLRYIEAFNAMESQLRAPPVPALDLNNLSHVRGLALQLTEKVQELHAANEAMRPKVEAHDRIAELEGSFCVRDAAKNLQIPETILWRYLRANGWVYRRPGTSGDIAYSNRIASGVLTHKVRPYQKSDGTEGSSTQVRVTPKGLTVLAQAFPPTARLV